MNAFKKNTVSERWTIAYSGFAAIPVVISLLVGFLWDARLLAVIGFFLGVVGVWMLLSRKIKNLSLAQVMLFLAVGDLLVALVRIHR